MLFILLVVLASIITHQYNQKDSLPVPYEVVTTKEFYVDCLCGKLERHCCNVCNGEGRILVDVQVERENHYL